MQMAVCDVLQDYSSSSRQKTFSYFASILSAFFINAIIVSSVLAEIPDDGLVKYMTFDNNEEGIFVKSNEQFIPGKSGKGLRLSGSRDYINLGDLSVMEDYTFTVSFWYRSNSSVGGWAFSEGSSSSNVPICGLVIKRNIKMFCRSTAGSSMKKSKTIAREINDDNWYHVALVGDGRDMILYIDGNYSGSMELPSQRPSFNMTSLGRLGRRSSGGYIDAAFDEARIYDRQLSDQEIANLAANNLTEETSQPVARNTSTPEATLTTVESQTAPTAKFELPKADLEKYFGRTPKLGVHPRILFGPDELPAIRNRTKSTGSGKKAYEIVKRTANHLRNGHLKEFYRALIRGDRNAIRKTPNCFWLDKARMVLSYEAYIILIDDIRGSRADEFARALTTFAEMTGGFYKKDVCNWSGDDHFALADLAYAYDFAYHVLSNTQRTKIRNAVAAKLNGKVGYGMDMPKNDRIAPPNFQMHGMSYYILNLAFEGQPGFNPSLNTKAEALAWDFVEREIHRDGTPREDMHYFNFGMEHGAEAFIAMARRGHGIINHDNYRRMLNWYIYSVEPYGYKFSTHGDTIRQGGGLMDNYTLLKYVWPNSRPLDYAWRNRMGDNYDKFNQFHDYLLPAIFGANLLSESRDAATIGMPLAFYSEDRGFSVARSSWQNDAISLRFSSRVDLHTTGHYHSDQNSFTLSARGRDWIKDWGYHSYRDFQHNLVLIDGQAQGYFPSASEFPIFIHNDVITTSVGDAQYAYTYRWVHNSRRGASGYKRHSWELEPNLDQKGRTNTTWRSKWNPVQKAFRTISLIRGQQPYVLVVDDVKKDDRTRVYDWLLQMLETNKVISKRDNEVILAQGRERLLVRIIHANERAKSSFENFRVDRMVDNGGVDRVHANIGTKRRLIFTTKAKELGIKVLLYPHSEGMPLPETSAGNNGESVQIKFNGQDDVFRFFDVKGRSGFRFSRNGKDIAATDD